MNGGITRFLPDNEYQAAISANAATALNPFATMADLPSAQNWQSVMSNGSSALGLTTDVLLQTTGIVNLISDSGTDLAELYIEDTVGVGLAYTKAGGTQSLSLFTAEITLTDTINTQGIVTGADFSPNYVPRSYTDKNYQDTHLGGKDVDALVTGPIVGQDGYAVTWDNTAGKYTLVSAGGGIYGGSDSLAGALTTVTMAGNAIEFKGTGNNSAFSVSNGVNKILDINTTNATLSGTTTSGDSFFRLSGALASYINAPFVSFHVGTTIGVGVAGKLTAKADGAITTAFVAQNGNASSTTVIEQGTTGRSGFGVTGASVTSKVTINGDVETLGTATGLVVEDRLGGGNKGRIYLQEDSPGVFTVYAEPA